MANIQIHAPDGSIAEFPEGTPDETITSVMAQSFPAPPSAAADVAKSAGIGLAKGTIGLPGIPGDVHAAGTGAINWAGDKLGLSDGTKSVLQGLHNFSPAALLPTSQTLQSGVEQATGKFYEPKTTAGHYAQTAGEFVPGAVAATLSGGATTLPAIARGAVQSGVIPGLLSEGAGQATSGTTAEPYARFAGGLLGGIAGPKIMNAPGRAISPMPLPEARAPLVQTLDNEGIALTAGQRSGSKPLQYMESALSEVTGAGGKAKALEEAQKAAFTEAALQRAGGTGGLATPENMTAIKDGLSAKYGELASRNSMTLDKPFAQRLGDITSNYIESVPPSQRAPGVTKSVMDLAEIAHNGWDMPGKVYQDMRSRYSKQAKALAMSDPQQADAYRSMARELDKNMERSIAVNNPADAGAWAETNRQYGNLKAIEKAAGAAGENAAAGYISPAALKNAISTGNNRGRYVRGEGDLAELARAGVGVMSPLPNSGTAARSHAQGILSGGSIAMGNLPAFLLSTLGPAVAGRALMSGPVQSYLSNQVAPRMGLLSQIDPTAQRLGLLSGAHSSLATNR